MKRAGTKKMCMYWYSYIKGTVAREKLLNWGLGEMDGTLTIDRM